MENVRQRNAAKEAVTIRLDVEAKSQLSSLARTENRTVSSLIDLAVREFLDRRFGRGVARSIEARLRVRHASLPDTCVLHAFFTLASEQYEDASRELNLPRLEFVDDRPEWSSLPKDLFAGESDLVESVNWLPIFWHVKRGGSAPRLDWIGPFLQLFVGHCVFVRADLASSRLDPAEMADFEAFRSEARTGKDLTLRSLVAWARHSGEKAAGRATALREIWSDAVVACQQGTDYHIAVRRVDPILSELAGGLEAPAFSDPTIQGIASLDPGFRDFCNGTVSGFTGNLLQTTELLTWRKDSALLFAGPADLRVPSLNTLAGHKGMFEPASEAADADPGNIGARVLELWAIAVEWFRNSVVNGKSDEVLREFLRTMFPDFDLDGLSNPESTAAALGSDLTPLAVLRSMMQTWVKWFKSPDEAGAFFGQNVVGGLSGHASAEDLVQHYEELCDLLNPAAQMCAPKLDDPRERALWQFPAFPERGPRASAITSGVSANRASGGTAVATGEKGRAPSARAAR